MIPAPAALVGPAIKLVPGKTFERLGASLPPVCGSFMTKDAVSMLWAECLETIKENKGLKIVHVEAQDGTYVSIKL